MTKLSMSEEEMLKRKYTRPYEKRIADLEKENADLKEEINKIAFARGNLEEENAELKKRNAELKGMYAHSAREAETYKQFLELKEKENAELKEKKEVLECDNYNSNCNLNLITDQLTKAKELIEDMYDAIPSSHSDYYKDVMERAKQFLSEAEK